MKQEQGSEPFKAVLTQPLNVVLKPWIHKGEVLITNNQNRSTFSKMPFSHLQKQDKPIFNESWGSLRVRKTVKQVTLSENDWGQWGNVTFAYRLS